MPKLYLYVLILLLLGSLSQAELVTAEIVAERCERYRDKVEYNTQYWDVDPDLVLAVMAKESACLRWATDGTSIGLMQVTPASWTATEAELYNVDTNIYFGMYILYSAINHPKENPEKSIMRGLAAYNCGWTSLNANRCIPSGGWKYASDVILFWQPVIKGELNYESWSDTMGSAGS